MSSPKTSTQRVRLRPADPFDLIRLLARSQSDPRKAVAELVQNSLDAGARSIEIEWFNESGRRALRIRDDGEGVFPHLDREAALRRIASTIGHSHKRSLTPRERREQLMLGKYGIGLLGFWSVGERLEMRSRVAGGETWCLRLEEDSPDAEVRKVTRPRLDETPTYTEVTLYGIHEGAIRQIRPAKLQAYLASELRGQLLRRTVEVRIRDRVARGRARKLFEVEPELFRGRRIDELECLEVPGYEEATMELYMLPPDVEPGRVALACGGTTVLDDLAQVDGASEPRFPWSSGRFEGVIDYPELDVAPGTRRGFQRDRAALHFLAALEQLELALEARLEEDERMREEERNQSFAREIRRAFVSVAAALPEYDLFDIRGGGSDGKNGSAGADGAPLQAVDEGGEALPENGDAPEEGGLFPPGPLAAVRITPSRATVPPGARRTLRARAVDESGRHVSGTVRWSWSLDGPGQLEVQKAEAVFVAPERDGDTTIEASAETEGRQARATATITVSEALRGKEKVSGIPEPQPVHAPLEPWRSRFSATRWQFNTGHRDYVAACDSETGRLRYLIHLLVKEVVLRNFQGAADDELLERMVEVLTHLGSARTPRRRRER